MRSRRSTVLLATVLLAFLAVAGTAAAAPGPRVSRVLGRALTVHAQRAFWTTPSRAARTVDPIGPFTLSGTVLEYDGAAEPEAEVFWGWMQDQGSSWWDGTGQTGGHTEVGDDGTFQFPEVTSVPGDDWLSTFSWDETGFQALDTWDNDFSAQQPYVVCPGRVRVETLGDSRGTYVLVRTGDQATSVATSEFQRPAADFFAAALAPGFVTAEIQAEDFRGAVTRAVGWVSPGYASVPVQAGSEAPLTLEFDWDDAVRGRIAGPMCTRSGPAGSGVTFVIDDWPAGTQVSFRGFSFADGGTDRFTPVVTPTEPDQTYRVWLTIPEDAVAGDIYAVEAYRSDDPRALLDVYDYYQVCDFGASRSVIERGQAVRLHGHVDGDRVTLFKRTSPATQPSKLSAPGWTKVRSFKTYGRGRFRTGFTRPGRTTWYVVRYDSGVFPAFTKVVKVKVRND